MFCHYVARHNRASPRKSPRAPLQLSVRANGLATALLSIPIKSTRTAGNQRPGFGHVPNNWRRLNSTQSFGQCQGAETKPFSCLEFDEFSNSCFYPQN